MPKRKTKTGGTSKVFKKNPQPKKKGIKFGSSKVKTKEHKQWDVNKRFNKKNFRIDSIHDNKTKAKAEAKKERKKGNNARVVTSTKPKDGFQVNIQTGPTTGTNAVFKRPRKKRKKKK